jgi:hypothetical protein
MLKLVHNADQPQARDLPLAGGPLALLPGPVLWISTAGQVIDANLAAIELMLDIREAAEPLRDAVVGTLADGLARQVRLQLNGQPNAFQVALTCQSTEEPGRCVIAVGQFLGSLLDAATKPSGAASEAWS